MFELIGLAAAGTAAVAGYVKSRSFVGRRLRYVDSVKSGAAPLIAGTVAAAAAAPVVALLPIIGAGTAIAFGIAVGAGTHAGVRDIENGST